MLGLVKTIIIAHKDRFIRFGYDWFERFLKANGVEIIVVNNEKLSPEQELVNDLISIIHVFSCRIYGLRKYKKKIEEVLMLYTSHLANLKNLPQEPIKLIITRYLSPDFDIKKYSSTHKVDALAPSPATCYAYKRDTNWDKYVEDFEHNKENRMDMYSMLHKLLKYLQAGKDVYIICAEKSNEKCYRRLVAEWFVGEGIPWKEV